MAARAPRLGRALQGIGLLLMPLCVVWGLMNEQLGVELLGAGVGFLLILTGRSLAAG